MKEPKYLGDGVYIQVDSLGYFRLTTGTHVLIEAEQVIVLEPEVAQALVDYITKP